MRLKSIRLAGFKSFVDPVTVPFDGNMTAIVGPNGCGKSNVIDAVRWVMGESSAKTLRGESMTDVIFNGSTERKPVGQASIELLFDNRDGAMGGTYAQYAEIAVKRLVTRDSQSSYFFNNQKCRRRDIADLFLGTGLGPRSYALIGQGMISRLIEARPEELRATLEEAAGISKYKERRRETENRMRRTQENLERLDDIREELDKQLERLKRQAEAARRYQQLKQQEHRLKGELALLRGRALRAEQSELDTRVRDLEIAVERELLGARQCETRLEEGRQGHDRLAERLDKQQAHFYDITTQVARLEQQLEHTRSREQQLARDLDATRRELGELARLEETDDQRLAELEERLSDLAPKQEMVAESLAQLEDALLEAEAAHQEQNQRWEDFNETHQQARREAERAQDRVRHLEQTLETQTRELERRRQQRRELPEIAGLETEREEINERLLALDSQLESLEERQAQLVEKRQASSRRIQEAEQAREALRERRSELKGELASLEALLQAALAENDTALEDYLREQGLADAPRLGEQLEVAPDWEAVITWVLSPWLKARLVAPERLSEIFAAGAPGALALLEDATSPYQAVPLQDRLADKVKDGGAVTALLADIRCSESAADAWTARDTLSAGESVITREGLWLGQGWARQQGDEDAAAGLLASRRRHEEITAALAQVEEHLADREQQLDAAKNERQCVDAAQEDHRREQSDLQARQQQERLAEARVSSRLTHLKSRGAELEDELARFEEQRQTQFLALEESRERWQQAMSELEDQQQTREDLENQRRQAQDTLRSLRDRERPLSQRVQQLALDRQRLTTERDGLREQRQRAEESRSRLEEKCAVLEEQREVLREPDEESRERLNELLEQRSQAEQTLAQSRDQAAAFAEQLHKDEQQRQTHERQLEFHRERLQETRLQVQALALKAEAQDEQLKELGHDPQALAAHLDANATESAWRTNLDEVENRLRRLGAINLTAIEEFDQQSERRNYLEAQHAELSEALDTLDRAIRKIDQETRIRFKQTFDRVDTGLQRLFPKVFGGGTAWLTLTGEDLLETGVAIMARPPGKKNSTIHLLSGGEKALTALSLVFAIFELNPAPFCMLDEVDAPLDDANVGRYAKLVKEMSERVQFIYITHNKIAMEAAERLMGVTMQEPGVSRLVSVGIEEASSLAEA
ncbi:chromosome segregation protein SMC [Pistricoccus aurantiacus]|uniref:chromosome segregation protein SMC n=1 Tax=Pistricoccus aurantiacus TaxID=1883414 RepID=UPI00362A2E48